MLRLYDTATGAIRPVELREPGRVSLYNCGPTVYDAPHIGHGRAVLTFDILRRYLVSRGYEVHHVSNVTDVDDHIIERAAATSSTEQEVARTYEGKWWEAMDRLDILRPDKIPHATAYVEAMVELVGELLRRGVAYETPDGIYFETASVPDYGLLARQPLDTLRAGARVAVDEHKRSPLDFALWKKAKPGEPTWEAPWGAGRPGWHTECVVMSLDLLGEGFDLHGGGIELAFPHHENERAQALADGRVFARHWVHHGHVTVAGDKMSKSLGNFTTLDDLLTSHDPRAYRLLVLRSHYRSPSEVTPETMADAEKALGRLDDLAARFSLDDPLAEGPVVLRLADVAPVVAPVVAPATGDRADDRLDAAAARFVEQMDDDMNTPSAVAGIFELVRQAHGAADAGSNNEAIRLAKTAAALCGALGLALHAGATEVDEQVAELAARRDAARAAKDWGAADAIRDDLIRRGWTVEDGPEGTRLRR